VDDRVVVAVHVHAEVGVGRLELAHQLLLDLQAQLLGELTARQADEGEDVAAVLADVDVHVAAALLLGPQHAVAELPDAVLGLGQEVLEGQRVEGVGDALAAVRVERDAAVGEDRAQDDAQERDLLGRGVQRLVGEEAADQAGAAAGSPSRLTRLMMKCPGLPARCTGDSSTLRW
jgi:hypothetical protein